MDQIEAGWYPDPTDNNFLRYWDSNQWTIHKLNPLNNLGSMDQTVPEELFGGALPPKPIEKIVNPLKEMRKRAEAHDAKKAQPVFAWFILILVGFAGVILLAKLSFTDIEIKNTVEKNNTSQTEPVEKPVKKIEKQ